MASFIVNFMGPTADDIRTGFVDSLNYLLENNEKVVWKVGKNTKIGDKVLFYCAAVSNARLGKVEKEIRNGGSSQLIEKTKQIRDLYKKYQGKIVASGIVVSDADYEASDAAYESEIGDLVILNKPLDYAVFKEINKINLFGSLTYLKEEAYDKLLQLIINDNPDQFENGSVHPQPFSEQEEEADKLPDSDLEKIARRRSGESKRHGITSVVYQRDPYISVYAKRRAKGRCDLCGKQAPFFDKHQKPYLECHHVEWLSRGGEDSVDNVVALCPNCHRRMHVLDSQSDIAKLEERLKKYKAATHD